ncbi:hypothetical protein QR685DRAFT_576550 [Neurospora intermedia]|uniref:Uncharacterized protein n=1 Tax=Neurospora intermedia TaxID=5142 RepID=A0ABR3CX59_NEUIN
MTKQNETANPVSWAKINFFKSDWGESVLSASRGGGVKSVHSTPSPVHTEAPGNIPMELWCLELGTPVSAMDY